jgi:4a-hydroxytetrahydrobiopterin dehydratase
MSELATKSCVPCRGETPPLKGGQIAQLHAKLDEGWNVQDEQRLEKEFKFDDFAQALAYVNQVGRIAEEEGHHPDIYLTWGKVKLTIWTHKIGGLTESDFVLAAKADAALDT